MSRAGLSTAIDADEHPLIRERGCLGCEKLLYYKEVKEIIIKKLSNSNIECEYILSQMVTLISLQDLIEIEKTDSEDGNDSKGYLYQFSYKGEDTLFDLMCRKQFFEAILTAFDKLKQKP